MANLGQFGFNQDDFNRLRNAFFLDPATTTIASLELPVEILDGRKIMIEWPPPKSFSKQAWRISMPTMSDGIKYATAVLYLRSEDGSKTALTIHGDTPGARLRGYEHKDIYYPSSTVLTLFSPEQRTYLELCKFNQLTMPSIQSSSALPTD